MKHIKNTLKNKESLKAILNYTKKKKNSVDKSKSMNNYLGSKLKSENEIDKIYIKEMKIISNVIKSLTIDAEKKIEDCDKSNDSYKYNEVPSLCINGSNIITKKNTLKNSATKDLISKIIEVNNESFLNNSPRENSNNKCLCQNDINLSNKYLNLTPLSKNYSFSKFDKKNDIIYFLIIKMIHS